jgi:hypothetical protein
LIFLSATKQTKDTIKAKKNELHSADKAHERAIVSLQDAEKEFADQEKRLNAISMGLSDKEIEEANRTQLKEAEAEVAVFKTEREQLSVRMQHMQGELKRKKAEGE